MVVNNMKAGSAIASNAPLMTRKAAKVAKFLETAWSLMKTRSNGAIATDDASLTSGPHPT